MRKIYTFLFSFLALLNISAQYCTNIGPSSTVDSNVESVVLVGVVGSINFVGCPGVVGLQDLTSQSTTLNAGGSYSAQIQFGTCNGNYSGAGQAWIDYDLNGTFDPSESIGTWSGIPPTAQSVFNFTVPAGAQNGTTRLRIIQQEAGALPLNPCATFTWGSAMDFGITIGNGIDCTGYVGDDMSDPIIVSTIPYTNTGDNSYCYSNQNLVYNSPDVYYEITPSPLMESITVTLCGSSFDTFLSIVDPAGNIIAYNDDAPGCGTQSALTFETAGIGLAYVIVEGWGSQSGTYNIAISSNYLALDEFSDDQAVLFPNPATDHFVISGIQGNIELFDISGKRIYSIKNYNGEQINVIGLEKGIYTVRYERDNFQFSQKLMIQ